MSLERPLDRPRVLRARLAPGGGVDVDLARWEAPDAGRARLATAGGTALAALLCADHAAREGADAPAPLVLAVGDAVRRGVPTAERVTVASRAPASGLYADGQLGGSLAARLASVADALVIEGRAAAPGAVLVIDERGGARVEPHPALVGATARDAARALLQGDAEAAALVVGPAGEAGFAHASLFSGEDPPSSVGRGGLGAVLGRLGLKAVVVAAPRRVARESDPALRARLVDSPRLIARAEGGTLELFDADAARRLVRGPGDAPATDADAARIGAGLAVERAGRHGCAGCPTPCGWVFDRPGGRRGARYSAVESLGPRLGLTDADDVLALLDACDAVGVDAKEVGERLARAVERGAAPAGDRDALRARIDALAKGEGPLVDERDGDEVRRVRGQVVREPVARSGRGGASLLGQCVSPRGADPMRAFPFLATDGAPIDASALRLPFALPAGASDAATDVAKGRLVWWHENLSAALDATGFCAFSAAALLADGVADADELARWILPAAWRGAEEERGSAANALQSLGASVVLVQRALNRAWGEPEGADAPAWARARIDTPDLLGEYRALRGVDARGAIDAAAWRQVGDDALAREAGRRFGGARTDGEATTATTTSITTSTTGATTGDARAARAPASRDAAPDPRPRGARVELRAAGAFGRRLTAVDPDWPVPLTVAELRDALRARDAELARWLGDPGAPLATVWRDGRRLAEDARIRAGDALELVVAISGG